MSLSSFGTGGGTNPRLRIKSVARGFDPGCSSTSGGVLAVEMRSLLLGEAASPDVTRRIEAEVVKGADVRQVIHLRTQHRGPTS